MLTCTLILEYRIHEVYEEMKKLKQQKKSKKEIKIHLKKKLKLTEHEITQSFNHYNKMCDVIKRSTFDEVRIIKVYGNGMSENVILKSHGQISFIS